MNLINNTSSKQQNIDEKFIKLTRDFKKYVLDVKHKFDVYDARNLDKSKRISFLEKQKEEIFKELDVHFEKIWKMVRLLDKEKYDLYKNYYFNELSPIFGEPIEINWHIYTKPFGYSGDYITMAYVYDYHNSRYLGDSTFQKLINNYTCNIPVSRSNIIRKDFLNNKIIETIRLKNNPEIASIGSGPMRELTELLNDNLLEKKTEFLCLDFENEALEHVKKELKKLKDGKLNNLSIKYLHKNIVQLIKEKITDQRFDLIYVAGVFDYLKDLICRRLTKILYGLLEKEGQLIICNVSLENSKNRAYYEFLGDWVMIHRTKAEMLAWTKELNGAAEIKFEPPSDYSSYLFLSIKK